MQFRRAVDLWPVDTRQADESQVVFADDSALALPTEVELLKPGDWTNAPNHPSFQVTESDIDEYVEHESLRAALPINLEHEEKTGAHGWLGGLFKRDGALWGKTDWTEPGVERLTKRMNRFISPEFSPHYKDPETGKEYRNVLTGAALTNKPLFKGLRALVASEGGDPSLTSITSNSTIIAEGEQSVNLAEVIKKDPTALTEDEKNFLAEHKAELSVEDRTKFGLTDAANTDPTAPAAPAAPAAATTTPVAPVAPAAAATTEPAAPAAPAATAPVAPVAASDGTVAISASELQALKDAAAQGVTANEHLIYIAASDKVKEWSQGETPVIKAGEDSQKRVTDFFLTLDATQKAAFDVIMAGDLNGLKEVQVGEQGITDAGAGNLDAASQALSAKADEIVKASEGKTPFSQALKQASKENPSLGQAYNAEIKAREKGEL